MSRPKGGTNKYWAADEKYNIIKPALDFEKSTWDITRETGLSNGMINNWIKAYREKSFERILFCGYPCIKGVSAFLCLSLNDNSISCFPQF